MRIVCTQGSIHPRPKGCSPRVYAELAKCWSFEPSRRPEFAALESFFEGAVTDTAIMGTAHSVASGKTAMHQYEYGSDARGGHGLGASGDANLDGAGYVVGSPAAPGVSAGDDYEMPTADNMRRLSAQDAAADEGDDADGYEMPTDDNMRRLSSGVSPVSTSGNAAAATATVTNNDWDHGSSATTALVDAEYYIAANTLFGIAEEGSAGAYANAPVKETSFGTAAPEHGKLAFVAVVRFVLFVCPLAHLAVGYCARD